MKRVEQKLMNIVCSSVVNQSDTDFFNDYIEYHPSVWSDLYLWSIENKNYQFSDIILECGFDINNNKTREYLIDSLGLYKKRNFDKIICDGYIIDGDFKNDVLSIYSSDDIFDKEYFFKFILQERVNKIQKFRKRYVPKISRNE